MQFLFSIICQQFNLQTNDVLAKNNEFYRIL